MDKGDPDRFGPYTVVRKLGEGGMGSVFEVRHDTIERRAAVKVLRAEYAQAPDASVRFINEARAVSRVEHPGLIQIYDFVRRDDGISYIVMEYLNGETISARLKRAATGLEVRDVIRLGWQVADCLAAAHSKGIIHRDLKPSNVMIVSDPHMLNSERTKVLDFGLAKVADAANVANTSSSVIMGTPLYMSPEQCDGANRVDERSDVYSLGCMLYEMLSGRPPFIGDGAAQILGMHMFKMPTPISIHCAVAPEALCNIIDAMLEKDKIRRPSMKEVANELKRMDSIWIAAQNNSATLVQLSTPFKRNRTRKLAKYTIYLLSVVSVVSLDRYLVRRTSLSGHKSSSILGQSTSSQSIAQSLATPNQTTGEHTQILGAPAIQATRGQVGQVGAPAGTSAPSTAESST